jgi:hypothetical protein
MRLIKIAALMAAAFAFTAGPAYSQSKARGNVNDVAKQMDKMSQEDREQYDKQMRIDRAYRETVDRTSGDEQKVDPWATVRPAPGNAKR